MNFETAECFAGLVNFQSLGAYFFSGFESLHFWWIFVEEIVKCFGGLVDFQVLTIYFWWSG